MQSNVVFFFQAEDGIRDDLVTGVQTCALPIYLVEDAPPQPLCRPVLAQQFVQLVLAEVVVGRSEERRVGKECRSRRSPDHVKNTSGISRGGYRRYNDGYVTVGIVHAL